MKFIMRDKFRESVPDNKKEFLKKKLDKWHDELINSEGCNWIKAVKSKKLKGAKNIFKFRLNSGDRILFTYPKELENARSSIINSIILLEYCKHDDQGRDGRKIDIDNIKLAENDLEINKNGYIENDFDNNIDKKYNDYTIDLNSSISYLVDDEKTYSLLLDNSDDKFFFYLNDEQYECVENRGRPLLLSGSAGSGKTTVGLHKLLTVNKNQKVCYITFTDDLKKHANEFFDIYNSNNSKVDFFTIKELCIKLTKLNEDNLVGFERFREWKESNSYKYLGFKEFTAYDLWSEIRGIIKGFMGMKWIRNIDITNLKLSKEKKDTLIEFGLAEELNNRILWKNDDFETLTELKLTLNDLEMGQDRIKTLISYLFDEPMHLIDLQSYLNLTPDYSIYSSVDRRKIYKFANNYQNWLDENNLFDDNDLAIQALSNISDKYDFIVVDEVQDLTELQIYFTNRIISNPTNLFYSGDIHQIINPTFFRFDRLETCYYLNEIKSVIRQLKKNYRSQDKIIKLANHLSQIRNKYIGKMSELIDYIEKPVREGSRLKMLKPSEENKINLFNRLSERAYVSIIVSSKEEKIFLKEKYNIHQIHTVEEIKGLENKYIISYNLLTNNADAFYFILNGNVKHNQKYRFYFNLFYVAITRAKDQLLLYEEKTDIPFLSLISEHFDKYEYFSEEELEIEGISTKSEWKKRAAELEGKEFFEQASAAYKKAEDLTGTKRTEAKILEKKGKFREAGLKMMEIDVDKIMMEISQEELDDYIDFTLKQCKREDDINLLIASYIWSVEHLAEVDKKASALGVDVIESLNDCKELNQELKIKLVSDYLEPKMKHFDQQCQDAEDIILILNLME